MLIWCMHDMTSWHMSPSCPHSCPLGLPALEPAHAPQVSIVAQSDMRCYAVKVAELVRRFPPAVIEAIQQFSASRVAFLESRLHTDSQFRALQNNGGAGTVGTCEWCCSGRLAAGLGTYMPGLLV